MFIRMIQWDIWSSQLCNILRLSGNSPTYVPTRKSLKEN